MANAEHSPFVVGARVAVFSGFRNRYLASDTVAKVYKTGNFTLAGHGNQQFRVWVAGQSRAYATGKGWDKPYCEIWDEDRFGRCEALRLAKEGRP